MNDLKISLVQTELHWENRHANLSMMNERIKAVEETDIIILPEMFSTGFTMNASSQAEKMDGQTVEWMRKSASDNNCIITGSVIIEEDGNYFNRLIWTDGNSIAHYDKRHLFTLANEEKTYTAGKHQWIMMCKGWRIFPLICYDLRFPVWSRRTKKMDYDLLIYVANWPERRSIAWKSLLPARAIENQSYVAGLNRVGNDGNNIYHSGDSVVYDFAGNKISSIPPGENFTQTVTLNHTALHKFRNDFEFGNDADNFQIEY